MTDGKERYVHGHDESVLRSHRWRTAENSAAHLLPHLHPGMRILDVGSGPGTITIELAERVAPGEVVGVDASAEIVEKAAADARERGVGNVAFRVGDAYALDLPDGSFDIVHAHQVLHHLARPVDALREWRRVLAPGGMLAVREIDYDGTVLHPLPDGLGDWAELYQRVHRANGGEPNAGRRLKEWVRAAGFTQLEAGASVWCFESDADRRWWAESWADRARSSGFARTAQDLGLASPEDLEAIAQGLLAWAAHPDGWLTRLHGEVIARP